jgi:histidyl-tRNA synthetase
MSVAGDQAAPGPDLYIAPLGETALRHAGALAQQLRRDGRTIEVGTDARLKKSMELANKLNARQVLIIGDDEIASGTYTLKNMATGEQKQVTRTELAGGAQ